MYVAHYQHRQVPGPLLAERADIVEFIDSLNAGAFPSTLAFGWRWGDKIVWEQYGNSIDTTERAEGGGQ